MRNLIVGLFVLLCAPALAQQQTPPIINFESAPNPLQLPDNMYFGEVSGIALNSKGHVFVLSRGNTTGPAYAAAATQLLEFDADGKFLREIGHNLYAWSFGHMVKIDRHDNIWVADKGSDMVIKFTPRAASPWCSGASRRPPTRTPVRSSTRTRRCRPSPAASVR